MNTKIGYRIAMLNCRQRNNPAKQLLFRWLDKQPKESVIESTKETINRTKQPVEAWSIGKVHCSKEKVQEQMNNTLYLASICEEYCKQRRIAL